MTSRDFCYWLQGYFEITKSGMESKPLTVEQCVVVRQHLAMVFKHEIDPSFGDADVQAQLDALHKGVEQAKAEASRPRPPKDTAARC